jgi:DNA-binding PucR family transcriptional regulator
VPLLGLREGDLVCLCPASSAGDLDQVKDLVRSLAEPLAELGVSVGIGSWHPSSSGVPTAYAEAREAAEIALRPGMPDRVVVFDDVLIDHVLRANPHAARIIEDALGPLRDYDGRRNTALVETLRTYLDTGLSITRSAVALSVHTNTVVYRLDRIRELTGRDPRKAGDLVFLALSLKLDGALA